MKRKSRMVMDAIRQRFTLSLLLAVLVVLAVGAGLLFSRGVSAGDMGEAIVRLVPPAKARAGEAIAVELVAENVTNLAGFEATIHYNPDEIRLVGARVEKELSRGGRDLMPLGPVQHESTVILGAATCPVSDCNQPYPFEGKRFPNGVDGRVVLATLTFYTAVNGQYDLSLEDVKLVDPQGNFLPVRSVTMVLDVTTR